ncbi:MAG TPA: VOC family protein [Acidobacteriota bacterium]|nr:VOC family protein [Acidobacteriota bacterium]HNB70528.1 VOC family protein [Acidobacteriota bacterium]
MASNVKPIPDGYHTVTPYLVVENPANLLEFLTSAFDARVTFASRHSDGSVGHAEVKIGDSMIMIGPAGPQSQPMPSMLYLYVPDTDAVYAQALKAGGVSIMEPANQFYGDRNAGVKDHFGNQWWIATHVEDVSPEELEHRAKAHGK